jgi:hypothetical protein
MRPEWQHWVGRVFLALEDTGDSIATPRHTSVCEGTHLSIFILIQHDLRRVIGADAVVFGVYGRAGFSDISRRTRSAGCSTQTLPQLRRSAFASLIGDCHCVVLDAVFGTFVCIRALHDRL